MLRLLRGKKGFTLVEVLVALVLVGILIAGGIAGVNAYVNYANFRTNNEYARTLFALTQSALADRKAAGSLKELYAELGGEKADMAPDSVSGEYAGRLQTLLIQSQGDGMDSRAGKVLRELIGSYVYDEDVFNASICVELDMTDGVVYSVLYSRQAAGFSYTGGGADPAGVVGIGAEQREYAARRRALLGYYGSELPDQEPASYGKPTVSTLRLDNGETLDLRWTLSRKFRLVTGLLTYTVDLYDGAGVRRLSLTVNPQGSPTALKARSPAGPAATTTDCAYTAYGGDGAVKSTGTLTLPAYVTDGYEVHLVLDMVDLAAADTADYSSTWSAMRLTELCGLKGDVYARLTASGKKYAASTPKQSNTEDLYMGRKTGSGGGYTLQNARHLFNLRFVAADTGAAVAYTQTASFSWGGADGLLAHGAVADSASGAAPGVTAAFPAVDLWPKNNTLAAADGAVIGALILSDDSADGTALFRRNEGALTGLTFTGVSVAGGDYTATLAGTNAGSVASVAVRDGTVTGRNCVGGVIGRDETTDQNLSRLSNGAAVSGVSFVGGILGRGSAVRKDNGVQPGYLDAGSLSGCANTGAVRGSGSCVGGIIGCDTGKDLINCTSAPAGSIGAASALTGTYVGGLVGLHLDGTITGCSTGAGLVSGYRFVGGVVGLNASGAALDGGTGGSRSRVDVIGQAYVGGITGANITVSVKLSGKPGDRGAFSLPTITPDFTDVYGQKNTGNTRIASVLISRWVNEGLTFATIGYAGGITGYNCGRIENCACNVSSVNGAGLLATLKGQSNRGNCVGGIAGANRGAISNSASASMFSVVLGNDFVGGIVGFNAATGVVSNCALAGGYVSGRCFVGGFAGLNCSRGLYDAALTASPNLVEGDSYVGGVLGGSIVRTGAYQDAGGNKVGAVSALALRCTSDNFLGSVTGTGCCVGGFAGYQTLMARSLSYAGELGNAVSWTDWQKNSDDEVLGLKLASAVSAGAYAATAAAVDAVSAALKANEAGLTGAVLTVGSGSGTVLCRLHGIQGAVYVGGVVGYNAANTSLVVAGVTNATPVTATGTLTENGTAFAYAGGILGRVTTGTVLDACVSSGTITHQGAYEGCLAEVNEGIIRNCSAAGLSKPARGGLGGLVGLNRASGTVTDCALTGALTGGALTGGIAAVNEGTIAGARVNGAVTGQGNLTGGVAGRNTGTVTGCAVAAAVKGVGNETGGVAGENGGALTGCTVAAVTVQGAAQVGGLVGRQLASAAGLSDLSSAAAVTGEDRVGGIAGTVEGAAAISRCASTGSVTANAGTAGGITAFNAGAISDCADTGSVYAPKAASCGGIAAENSGSVSGCAVGSAAGVVLTVTGQQNVGGVTGANSGTVSGCTLYGGLTVLSRSGGVTGGVGGVAGVNSGRLALCATSGSISVKNQVGGGALGGVAGLNDRTGRITGAEGRTSFAAAVTLGEGLAGYTGGLVGRNLGLIENYTFAGSVSATGSEDYGYGGVAGVNGDEEDGSVAAVIRNCAVDDGVQRALTASWAFESGGYTLWTSIKGDVCVGGIAGSNCAGASVTGSTLLHAYIRGDYGFVGGIVGRNRGSVSGCRAPVTASGAAAQVKIRLYNGDLGGVVGRNEQTGAVNDCATGSDWIVLVGQLDSSRRSEATDNTCAGIIGYNCSDLDMANLVNYAAVSKTGANLTGTAAPMVCGGVIGRQENTTRGGWTYTGFENRGSVAGGQRVAGIVAHWKYNGGTLLQCENRGSVTGASAVGGMIGSTYSLSGGETVCLVQCRNHGTVSVSGSAQNREAGGLVGWLQNGSGAAVIAQDCVNTGAVSTGGYGGGLVGRVENQISLTINRSVNYYAFSGSLPGLVGSAASWGKVVITNSVNVPKIDNGISGGSYPSDQQSNYCLVSSGDGYAPRYAQKLTVVSENGQYNVYRNGTGAPVIENFPYDPNDAAHKGTSAYDNYLALDPYLKKLLVSAGGASAPLRVSLETGASGNYTASWDAVSGAYYYTAYIELLNAGTNTWESARTVGVYVGESLSFSVDAAWRGREMRVSVATRDSDEKESAGRTASNAVSVLPALATPSVCYELQANGSFRCRLLNAADYADVGAANVLITVNVMNGSNAVTNTASFTAAAAGTTAALGGSDDGTNIFVSAWAAPAGTLAAEYIQSSTRTVQTQRYLSLSKAYAAATVPTARGFTGIRPSELSYVLDISMNKTQTYRRTEFLAQDAQLGWVVVSSDLTRVSGTHHITLSGLAELSGGQSVRVRSYPWGTQNLALMFGHEAGKNVSRAALLAGTCTDPVTGAVVFAGGALQSGYVLERVDTDVYNVYYSAALATGNLWSDSLAAPAAAAAPVLQGYTADGGVYTFTWTQSGGAAVYDVSAWGTSVDGTEASLGLDPAAASGTANQSIAIDLSGREYKQLRLQVTRLGTESGGYTTALPASAMQSWSVALPLPALTAPQVSFDTSDRDNVFYNVSWTGETGAALADTDHYELHLVCGGSDTVVAAPAASTASARVDLQAYQGQSVSFYLLAKIVASPANYRADSAAGAAAGLTVTRRIALSSSLSLSLSPGYAAADSVGESAFASPGVTLTVSDGGTADAGSFVFQAAVYDAATVSGGSPAGVKLADIGSGAALAMTSSVSNSLAEPSSSTLAGLSAAWAGRWLLVRVRAVSGSMVSSEWSAWQAFRLPRVQLSTPALSVAETAASYPVSADSVDVQQQTLRWSWGAHVDSYTVVITPLVGGSPGTPYTLSISGAGTTALQHSAILSGPDGLYTVTVTGQLIATAAECTLVLPDFEDYTYTSASGSAAQVEDTVLATYSVSVTAVASDGARYAASAVRTWRRTADGAGAFSYGGAQIS